MIYTVTFNPALDYVMRMEHFEPGQTNRSVAEELYLGGKGINVTVVLHALGIESTALGFIAGFTGDALERGLTQQGICTDFIRLQEGMTRINVKLKTGKETEINAQGPAISADALEQLHQKLDLMQPGDTLVLAGSVPGSMPADIYERILHRLQKKDLRFVVDATGDLLVNVLRFRPFLIKPNKQELAEIVGEELMDETQIAAAAKRLQQQGAQNVLVSLGKDGALLASVDGQVLQSPALGGKPVNTVGAGDSMVAGFLAGYNLTGSYAYALQMGSAAGGATACSSGLATGEQIRALMRG